MKLPSWLKLPPKKDEKIGTLREPQTDWSYGTSWGGSSFQADVPFKQNLDLIDTLRTQIPLMDAIPARYINLMGDIDFIADDKIKEKLEYFRDNVKVNNYGSGIYAWIYQIMDSGIAKGMAFAELIPTATLNDVWGLKNTKAQNFRFVKNEDGTLAIAQKVNGFKFEKIKEPEWVYYYAPDQRDGMPYGFSMYHSTQFVSQIYLRMLKSVDNAVWRIGDPTFFFSLEGGANVNYDTIRKASVDLKSAFNLTMQQRRQGKARDMFMGLPEGTKLKIQMLGEKGKMIDGFDFSMKTIIEELAVKSGFPLWIFGKHWATSRQTLAKYESDFIVSNVKAYRRYLDPILSDVFRKYLILTGDAGAEFEHVWGDVNLMDEKEQADAQNLAAQAQNTQIQTLILMDESGWLNTPEPIEAILEEMGLTKHAEAVGFMTGGKLDVQRWEQHKQEMLAIRMTKMLQN